MRFNKNNTFASFAGTDSLKVINNNFHQFTFSATALSHGVCMSFESLYREKIGKFEGEKEPAFIQIEDGLDHFSRPR